MKAWREWFVANEAARTELISEKASTQDAQPGQRAVRRISIVNQKGGVGKTTLSFHLGGALAALGFQVLVVDCDSQGSLSATLSPDHEKLPHSVADIFSGSDVPTKDVIRPMAIPNLYVIPADERLDKFDRTAEYENDPLVHALADALTEVEAAFDFLLFDCPPRRSLTTFATLVAADEVIVPVECDVLSLYGIVKLQQKVDEARQRLNPRVSILGYVLSRFQADAALQRTYRKKLEDTFGADKILATIPEMRVLANAMSFRKPITSYSPKSRAAAAIRKLADKIANPISHAQDKTAAA